MDTSSNQIVSQVLARFKTSPSKYIIDVGASEGRYNSSSFYLINALHWSGLLLEPMPHQFSQLQALYQNRYDVNCINAALTYHDGVTDIYLHPNDGNGTTTSNHGSSLIKPEGSQISIKVPTISFKTLCTTASDSIGLLAIDTEGYDLIILQELMKCGMRPHAIISENFFEHKDEEKHLLLNSYGYDVVIDNHIDTGWVLKEYL